MPDSFKFPGMLSAVIPLVCGERLAGFGRGVINELVADFWWHAAITRGRHASSWSFPGLAAVIRALNNLSKPTARLRRINTVRIGRRSLQVIHLPPGKVGPAYIPIFALSVRRQNERAFARTNQNPHLTHSSLLLELSVFAQSSDTTDEHECSRHL